MKRLFIAAVIMMAIGITAQAQDNKNIVISKEGKTFTATKTETAKAAGYTPTGYTYIDTDGQAYEIHVHTTQKGKNKGVTRCYIQRTSKETGKKYWKVIDVKPEELV